MNARTFGEVVSPSGAMTKESNLSFEIVGILVNSGKKVIDEMSIIWNGVEHRVWISEVMRDWVPDFFLRGTGAPKHSKESDTAKYVVDKTIMTEVSDPINDTMNTWEDGEKEDGEFVREPEH
ncbi:hypothetical protein HanRHA438_Chr17g0835591 [Helianthus annuus]|nr:hypothetical protein HanRHA438_Chr17g0835591 [Helianthus annuus]